MSDTITIRAATDADWPGVWAVLEPVFRAGETYTYPRDIREESARASWLGGEHTRVLVAVDAGPGDIVGTAKYLPNHPGAGAHVANASFAVAARAAGRGVGRALGQAVIDAARADGYRAIQFNAVVDTNVAAVRLWESLGFATLATVPEAFAHPTLGPVGLRIMHRFL
ncbi:GNAT family N-acetyltransferase [Demequina globuliformis]|uniref:GNAT family N-acetyltransferase n=1 Tax=Demequina globuliformis TaxID=676202 RepID=UPI000ABBB643|nr:GNAT family N-acetyltransferase [Demequina globuliformis]